MKLKSTGGLLVGKTDINGREGIQALQPDGKPIKLGGGEIVLSEKASTENCEELSRMNVEAGAEPFPCDHAATANTTRASGAMPKDEYYTRASAAGGRLVGSSPTKEGLESLINKYFYSTSYRIEDGKLYSSKGLYERGYVENKKGRWRFVMNEVQNAAFGRKIPGSGDPVYIDDSKYKWNIGVIGVHALYKNKRNIPLGKLIYHPNLFKDTPKLSRIPISFINGNDNMGETTHSRNILDRKIILQLNFDYYEKTGKEFETLDGKNPEDSKEAILLHEIQHLLQYSHHRPEGISRSEGSVQANAGRASLRNKAKAGLLSEADRRFLNFYETLTNERLHYFFYLNDPGEIEARSVVAQWLKGIGVRYVDPLITEFPTMYGDSAAGGAQIPARYKAMGFTEVGHMMKSSLPEKKWMVLAKKGDQYKVVHGGQKGMEDFSQHKDEARRRRFWERMGGEDSERTKDPFSPLYWHKKYGTWAGGGLALPSGTPSAAEALALVKEHPELLLLAGGGTGESAADKLSRLRSDWLKLQTRGEGNSAAARAIMKQIAEVKKQKNADGGCKAADGGIKTNNMKKYKYTFDNPDVIRAGTIVIYEGEEREIAEASDKSLRLEGAEDWIHISEVEFPDKFRNTFIEYPDVNPAASGAKTPTTAIWQGGLYYLLLHNMISDSHGGHFKILGYKKTHLQVGRYSDLAKVTIDQDIEWGNFVTLMNEKKISVDGCPYENDRDKALLQNEIAGIVKAYELQEKENEAVEALEMVSKTALEAERKARAADDTIKGMEALAGGGQEPLTEKYATIRKWSDGFPTDGDIQHVLDAIIASGYTDKKLKTKPTKTGTQYKNAQESKTNEVFKKIKKHYSGNLKGNMPWGIIYTLVDRASRFDDNILAQYKGGSAASGKAIPLTLDEWMEEEKTKGGELPAVGYKKYLKGFASENSIPNNYKGKNAQQVWDMWDQSQRLSFINDHMPDADAHDVERIRFTSWAKLNPGIMEMVRSHVADGQYAGGGRFNKDANTIAEDIVDNLKGYKYISNSTIQRVAKAHKIKTTPKIIDEVKEILEIEGKSVNSAAGGKKNALPTVGGDDEMSESETRTYIQNMSEEDWNRLKPENKVKYKKYRKANAAGGGRQDGSPGGPETMKEYYTRQAKEIQEEIDSQSVADHGAEQLRTLKADLAHAKRMAKSKWPSAAGGRKAPKVLTENQFSKKVGMKRSDPAFKKWYSDYKSLVTKHGKELNKLDKEFK